MNRRVTSVSVPGSMVGVPVSATFTKGGPAVTRESWTINWLELIAAEYREMPGLALTLAQAQRLWGLDAATCKSTLEQLRREGFLRLTRDGRYCRNEAGA